MNTKEYFAIVHKYRPSLKALLINIVRNKLNIVTPAVEQIEDTLNEVILTTAEKIDAGTLSLHSPDEVEMYLTRSAWFDFKNKSKRKSQDIKKYLQFQDEYYRQAALEDEDPIITNTSEIYTRIFRYVYDRYEHEEAGIYKAHTIHGFTFDQLAEATGVNRNKCYQIVKKIRADVRANKSEFLNGEELETYIR